MSDLRVHLRRRRLERDARGRNCWQVTTDETIWPAERTALLLCDVWDNHWCRGAVERLEVMIPRMDEVARSARAKGVTIIHAPSETMDFYADHLARRRALDIPRVDPPPPLDRPDPALPVDASDEGSDTGETSWYTAWSRQHPGIGIDDRDLISDDGGEVYSCLRAGRLEHLAIMGVHTNMCVLHRSFAIKQMVRWGVDVALVRDLTDAMYNPAMSPYVSHDDGTRLVVEFIEKFWCPSFLSADLTA
jgi:nicotinamidase-related amidase